VIEIADIEVTARYYKIHTTVGDTNPASAEFSAGTDYGGARAFKRG